MTKRKAILRKMPEVHDLKCWPDSFNLIADGTKTFEIRTDDRDYQEGDYLFLREYDPERAADEAYSGRTVMVYVQMIIGRGSDSIPYPPGLVPENVVIMGICRGNFSRWG